MWKRLQRQIVLYEEKKNTQILGILMYIELVVPLRGDPPQDIRARNKVLLSNLTLRLNIDL